MAEHDQNALCLHKFNELVEKISNLHEQIERLEESTDKDLAKLEESLSRIRSILTGNGTIGVYQRIGEAEREITRMTDDIRHLQEDIEKAAIKLSDSIKSCQEGIQWINRWLIGILGSVVITAIVAGVTWFAVNVVAKI